MEINPVQPLRGENPVITFPDSLYGGNGDRMIITQPPIQPDNPQSTIFLPEGGRVTAEVVFSEAAGSARIDLLQRQPNAQTLLEYANHNIGYSWVSEGYPPNTSVEFGIWWYYNSWGTIYQGYEAGAIITQTGANKYQIGFEAAGDDWDYNELIIEVTIEDFELLVTIEPPTISTGETALIRVKKQFYDGRVEDFPAGQLFEVGMMEGCAAGGLVSGTDTAAYFNGVTQPMLFVAADSLENDEETVLIGVGLIQQSPTAKMSSSSKKEIEKESSVNKNQAEEIKDEEGTITDVIIIGGTCFGEPLQSTKQGVGNLVVEDNWCDDLDECDEIEFPDIDFDVHENNWEGLDVCGTDLLAGTDFLKSENSHYREDFDIELCKEEGSDKVQFTFDDDIVINCISDMCEDHISAGQDILIADVYSFPENTSCGDKLFWIELHKRYPYPTRIKTPTKTYESVYVIKDIWMRHEKTHRDHFLEVAGNFKSKYLTKIRDTKKKCSDFTNEENAVSFFKKKAEEIIKNFYDEVKKEDDRISAGGDDGNDVIKFEKEKIHKKVIDEYIQPLINLWKLNNCVD